MRNKLYYNYLRYINAKAKDEPKTLEEIVHQKRQRDEKNQRRTSTDEGRNPPLN